MITRAPQLSPMTAEKVALEWYLFRNSPSSFSVTSSTSSPGSGLTSPGLSSFVFLAAATP